MFLPSVHDTAKKIPVPHNEDSNTTILLRVTNCRYLILRRNARYLSRAIAGDVKVETEAIMKPAIVVGWYSAQYWSGSSWITPRVRAKCSGATIIPTPRSENAKLLSRALEGECMDWLFFSAIKIRVFPSVAEKKIIASIKHIKINKSFENSCKNE